MTSDIDIDALLAAAHAAADVARPETLALFRAPTLAADNKDDDGFDPVTAADRASERAIRALLARLRPEDGVRGEEEADTPGRSGVEWVIDPIDGTRAYLCGAPSWGVLIAAGPPGRPAVGIIDQPFTGERFVGISLGERRSAHWSRGAERRSLRTRRIGDLGAATLMTTYPEIGSAEENRAFEALRARTRLTRYGFDCYAYGLLALGQVDLVVEAGLKPYDVQALIPVVEGAGGVITDWTGGGCAEGGRVIAAGDPTLHAEALRLLAL